MPGIFNVAHHQGDFGGNFARGAGVGNGGGVGAFAGAKDAKTEFSLNSHALFFLQNEGNCKHFPLRQR